MRPHYSIITPATFEPLTLTQAADHVRVDSADDLPSIQAYAAVAREYVEGLTGRVFAETGFCVVAESWSALFGIPCRPSAGYAYYIPLFRTPLVSVESISYYAPDATTLTVMDPDDYIVITTTEPGMVKITGDFPSVDSRPDAIRIEFTAGNSDPALISPMLQHAVKVDASNRYENRNSVSFGQSFEIDSAFRVLIENQKIGGWIG